MNNIVSILISIFFIAGIVFLWSLQKKGVGLGTRVGLATIIGIVFGIILQLAFGVSSELIAPAIPLFSFFSKAYTTLLRLLVVPIILLSIITIILNLDKNSRKLNLAKVTGISAFILLINTALASLLGVGLTTFFRVGESFNIVNLEDVAYKYEYKGILDSVLGFIPKNIFATLSGGNALQVLALAVLLGAAIALARKTNSSLVNPVVEFIEGSHEVIKELVRFVIAITPFGVYSILARTLVLNKWNDLFASLGSFTLANIVGFVILFFWQVILASFFRKISPFNYIRRVSEALIVAFSTRSSFSTVPVTSSVLKNEFEIHEETSNAIPSVASSIGMNACAGLWPAIVAASTIVATGQNLTLGLAFLIAGANAIASIGISGIPGTATVAASASFSLLGIPFVLIPLVQSIDYFIDMGRTALNVNGGVSAAVIADQIVHNEQKVKVKVEVAAELTPRN